MAKFSRWLAGTKAQSNGASFEAAFETICNQNSFSYLKIPKSCKHVGMLPNGQPRLQRIKSPFDYVIAHKGFSACVDTKTTDGKTWAYSDSDPDQLVSLSSMRPNMLAGYIVHHSQLNTITFYDVLLLNKLRPRESLVPEDGLILGTFGYICDLTLLKLDQHLK